MPLKFLALKAFIQNTILHIDFIAYKFKKPQS